MKSVTNELTKAYEEILAEPDKPYDPAVKTKCTEQLEAVAQDMPNAVANFCKANGITLPTNIQYIKQRTQQ